jgi:hypothetical protein
LIAFGSQAGHLGGIGNLLFQYAFTRTTARRLGVKFWFPEWMGDKVFCLNDRDERSPAAENLSKTYVQPRDDCGFVEEALTISDGTDIYGYFQSEAYFLDPDWVREWFTFREEAVANTRERYRAVDFERTTSIHFRFGDKLRLREMFVLPGRAYYAKALSAVKNVESLLVLSDDIERADAVAGRLGGNTIYADGNRAHEDLYLMSQCHDNICSTSTFSWWGAWLNGHDDKVVVCPKEWLRPGYHAHRQMTPNGWIEIQTVKSVLGHHYAVLPLAKVYRTWDTLKRKIRELSA